MLCVIVWRVASNERVACIHMHMHMYMGTTSVWRCGLTTQTDRTIMIGIELAWYVFRKCHKNAATFVAHGEMKTKCFQDNAQWLHGWSCSRFLILFHLFRFVLIFFVHIVCLLFQQIYLNCPFPAQLLNYLQTFGSDVLHF